MLPWDAEELIFDETRFSGVARLFPLPDLVMFPHVMQPLHVFEPRYREMLNDALDSDGLIAMSILAPGWEANYSGRPRLLPQVCLGKVIAHHRLKNGRYNIMLLGSRRARIIEEVPSSRRFRQARLELVDDRYPVDGESDRADVHAELGLRFQQALPLSISMKVESPIHELLASELPLGVLTDLVSFALSLPTSLKIELLAEADVDRRAQLLLDALRAPKSKPAAAAAAAPRLPLGFSRN